MYKPLDSGLRRNDDKSVVIASRHDQHTVILDGPTPALKHVGIKAFGELSDSAELTEDRAVVEPRGERAAEEARKRPAKADTLVIPAKAGIQWFIAYIPAQAGMTMRSEALKMALAILTAGS